jgi:hypothetical protein
MSSLFRVCDQLLITLTIGMGSIRVLFPASPVRLAYQPPTSSTFLSQQTSHQQPANSAFLSEQISTSHQPPAKRIG